MFKRVIGRAWRQSGNELAPPQLLETHPPVCLTDPESITVRHLPIVQWKPLKAVNSASDVPSK